MKYLLGFWLAFLVTISLLPLPFKERFGTMGRLHDPGHFFGFLVAAFLFCRWMKLLPGRILGCVAALGLALLLEGLEVILYRNRFEWHDVRTDGSGILVGIVLATLFVWNGQAVRQRLPGE